MTFLQYWNCGETTNAAEAASSNANLLEAATAKIKGVVGKGFGTPIYIQNVSVSISRF